MDSKKKTELKECRSWEETKNVLYGPAGTPTREAFEQEAELFILSEKLREARLEAGITQEELANRIGTKKSYISRLENGHADVQLSTLYKIFAGLGKRVSVTVL